MGDDDVADFLQAARAIDAGRLQQILRQCLQAGEIHDHRERRYIPDAMQEHQGFYGLFGIAQTLVEQFLVQPAQ